LIVVDSLRSAKGGLAMPEAKKPWSVMDPTELWKQWYEASVKAWSDALDGGKEPYVAVGKRRRKR